MPLLALPAGQLADRLPRVKLVLRLGLSRDAVGDGAAPRRDAQRRATSSGSSSRSRSLTGSLGGARQPGRPFAGARARARRAADRRARAALDRGADGDDRRPGRRRPALRDQARVGLRARRSCCSLVSSALLSASDAPRAREASSGAAEPRRACSAGIRFIRRTPVLLGAITLDLFAVLFGGAVALLPLFAQSILHVGPFGLGVLRSAVAVGALIGAIRLARRPLDEPRRPHAAARRRRVRREHDRLRALAAGSCSRRSRSRSAASSTCSR